MKTLLAILFIPLLAFGQIRYNYYTTNLAPKLFATNVVSGGTIPSASLGTGGAANSVLAWNGTYAQFAVVTNISGTATNVINTAAGTLVSIVTNSSTLITISADSQTNAAAIIAITAPLTNAAGILAITAQQTNTAQLETDLQIEDRTNANSIITIASPLTNALMPAVTNAAAYQATLATNGLIKLSDVPIPTLDQVAVAGNIATNTTYNVKQAGAVGNGIIDDTIAIQSALTNSCVYFPPGNYLSSNLVLTANKTIYGEGATLVFNTNCTGILLDCQTNRVVIRSLDMDGGGRTATPTLATRGGILMNSLAAGVPPCEMLHSNCAITAFSSLLLRH